MFDFPTSPAINTLYPTTPTGSQPQYKWDGEKWISTQAAGAGFLPLAGGTLTGNLTIAPASGSAYLVLNALAAQTKAVWGQSGGSNRWAVSVGTGGTESGGNVANDFTVSRFDDTGAYIDNPLTITRSNGWIDIGIVLRLSGAAGTGRQIVGRTGTLARWDLFLGNGVAESGSNAGSDFVLQRFTDAGNPIDNPISVLRSTGAVTIPNGINLSSTVASGNRQINGQTSGVTRWALIMANSAAETGSNAGSDFILSRYNDAGVPIDSPIAISRQWGGTTLNIANDSNALSFPQITGAAGIYRLLLFRTSGVSRWAVGMNNTAEGGSNAGSDFSIVRYNDAGSLIDFPLTISRATGQATFSAAAAFSSTVTVTGTEFIVGAAGTHRNIQAMSGASLRWQMSLANNGTESGANLGSDFALYRYADNGAFLGTPFTIQRADGAASFTNNLAVGGIVTVTGNINCAGIVTASTYLTTPNITVNAAVSSRAIVFQTNGVMRWAWQCDTTAEGGSNAGSNFGVNSYGDAGGNIGSVFSIVRATRVVTFGVAIVNGPSDRSLKQDIAPLQGALAKVMALQGVSFTMKDDEWHKPQIGLIAQDVEAVVPEVIQPYISDKGDGLLALDYPKLVALLIEGMKEQQKRIEALEGARQ